MLCFINVNAVIVREKRKIQQWSLYPLKRTLNYMRQGDGKLYGDLMSFSDWNTLQLKFNDGLQHHDTFTDTTCKYILHVGTNGIKDYNIYDKNNAIVYTDSNVISLAQLCIPISIAKSHNFIVEFDFDESNNPTLIPVKHNKKEYIGISPEINTVMDTYNDITHFNKDKKYKIGDVVKYNDVVYVCIKNIDVNVEFNVENWKPVLSYYTYNDDTQYIIGDIIRYKDNFYVCIKDTTGNAVDSEYWTKLDMLIDYITNNCSVKIKMKENLNDEYILQNISCARNIYNINSHIKMINGSSLYEGLNHANYTGLNIYKNIAADIQERPLYGYADETYKVKYGELSNSLKQYYLPTYRDGETNNNRPIYEPWTMYDLDFIINKSRQNENEYRIPLFDLSPNWE